MNVFKQTKPLMSLPDAERWANDAQVWQAFKQGNREAFEFLYQQNIQHLIQYGSKITSDRSLIQDCIQDLFVELWDSRENASQVASAKHYLLKSLRYKLIRYLQYTPTETLEETKFVTDYENGESQLLQQETVRSQGHLLAAALKLLPKRQQEAIHLRYFEELSNEEVAQVMGVNYQSACKFIYTGLKTLRHTLQLISLLPPVWSIYQFFKIL
ncbi:RNA polymerase sigma factor [Spirosoma fluviale]|uniref:RNA polymerase sigma factor, sigma-70 family n=1 Tax=Spirosoma fluviale TaxID=1597977 RepID=A0A286GAY8_9BACT|nr:sigma-70 family RNA polymerase sigma factor [Spirosoma fluviale]SOD92670.1 RNA polymerase sigma factor, sigma-70 family [Spirosoma fluviale]